jgi:hypothetical protein
VQEIKNSTSCYLVLGNINSKKAVQPTQFFALYSKQNFQENIIVVMHEGTCFLDAPTRVEWAVSLEKYMRSCIM